MSTKLLLHDRFPVNLLTYYELKESFYELKESFG